MLEGRFFSPGSARFTAARAGVRAEKFFRIESSDGTVLEEAPLQDLQVSPRLGNLPRRFTLPSGALFECEDNNAADVVLERLGSARGGRLVDRLERSWHWAVMAILVTVLAGLSFVVYGIPATAKWLALNTPAQFDELLTREALRTLEQIFLDPSTLTPEEQAKALALFERIANEGARNREGYRLLLRTSPLIGPNAFALPDGTVVLTDELWKLRAHDEEIEAVFAHEISHVDRRHSLQSVYQAALVPAAIALVTGDPTQAAQMATILPGILVQSSYSRSHEQEADDDAAAHLRQVGIEPSRLADILERIEAMACEEGACTPSWLGTHPETAQRASQLRDSID